MKESFVIKQVTSFRFSYTLQNTADRIALLITSKKAKEYNYVGKLACLNSTTLLK